MDTRLTHNVNYGIIMGQWWRHKTYPRLVQRIRWLTKKGFVRMDMPPKMPGDRIISIMELITHWELVHPVKIHPYTQPDGITRYQVISDAPIYNPWDRSKRVIGELRDL